MDSEAEVTHTTVIFSLFAIILIAFLVQIQRRKPDLRHIPTVGPSIFPFSYVGAINFFFNAERLLLGGYQRYRFSAFKVAQFTRWVVIVTGPQLIEELRKAPEDEMSYNDATAQDLTWAGIHTSPDQAAILSTQLTRNLPLVFSELRDEMVAAFSDTIPNDDASEWISVSIADAMTEIVSRLCNRAIIGPQACQDPELTALNNRFLKDKAKNTALLGGLHTIIFTGLHGHVKRVHQFLEPIIEHRRQKGEYPHNLLASLTAEASGPDATRDIISSVIALNHHAVPTTSLTFTHALYHLALASPSDVAQPMRDEVEAAVRRVGWTLSALERMRRVDSFLKESMRVSGLHALTMIRKSRTQYTFSDGTHVPPGTLLAAACVPTHFDPVKYSSPRTFDALRFVQGSGEAAASRYQLSTTAPDFLAWGYGRAACPGRFVAAAQMKLMLAHVVLHYDVKLGEGAGNVRPRDWWVGPERLPDLGAQLMFRRRR